MANVDAPSEQPSEGEAPRRISVELLAELRARAALGESIASLARSIGFSENAVRRAVRGRRGNHGIARKDAAGAPPPVPGRGEPGRPPAISAERVERARSLRAGGASLASVARELGVSRSWVRRVCSGDARLDVEASGAVEQAEEIQ